MGEFARALGTEEEITFEGKTYRKSGLTLEVIADFELFLENRAFEVLERRRLRMDPSDYNRRYDSLIRDIAAGSYGFLSETGQSVYSNSMTDPKNQAGIELLYLRLYYGNPGNPDITRDMAAKYIESNFEGVLKSFRKENTPDPNCPAPQEEGSVDSGSKPSSPESQESHSTSPSPNAES